MSTGASLSAVALAMLLASPSDESAAQQANTTEARGAILVQVTDTSISGSSMWGVGRGPDRSASGGSR